MTPIFGLVVALCAGLLAPRRRAVLTAVIPPMLAMTAVQSWYLGTGRGHNPASTTTDSVSYWIVQVIIIAVMYAIALGIFWLRARRAARRGTSTEQTALPERRLRFLLIAGTVAAFAVTLGYMFTFDRPAHPGSGNGNLPVTGVVGLVIGVVALAAFGLLWLRDRHSVADRVLAR
jgi:hypothetical protein